MKVLGRNALTGVLLLMIGTGALPGRAAEQADGGVARLEAEVNRLRAENARLKQLLAEHGIEPGNGYQSIVEILDELPRELKAARAWDKFSLEAVYKWLSEHPIGEPFEASLQVGLVQVGKNPAAASSPTIGWMVSIHPAKRDFKFRGVTLTQTIGGNWPLPLRLYGDAEFARGYEKLKAGQRITVRGKVRSIRLGPEQQGRREAHIGLSDISLDLPGR